MEVRACEIFLSGLKKLLVSWGFDAENIRWDTKGTEKTLKIKNETKVTVSIHEGKFHCVWEKSWKEKQSLHASPELQALLTKVGDMVGGASKGKGRGKSAFE